MNIDKNVLSTLTEEQKKKIETVRSAEELASLAREAGYELSEAQLESVAGGSWICKKDCNYDSCRPIVIQ